MKQERLRPVTASKQEIGLFVGCLLVMSLLYSTPRLVAHGFTLDLINELLVDCSIMSLSCLPIWWLHFTLLAHWPLKNRFAAHVVTAACYYSMWVGLYQIYNPLVGKPMMSGLQILQNAGPNLLFYIQVFSILHICHFFREREAQLLREKALADLAYQSEINALKAQIQPHFLFNTLNSISASLPPQQESTRILIAKLADTFRYALQATQETLVPLSSELEFIQIYLALEQARFGKRLQFHIEADSGLERAQVPPLLLQPLVENALKHAIEPSLDGGQVDIVCRLHDNKAHIRISNTGIPYKGDIAHIFAEGRIGLSNTAKRLFYHSGEELTVEQSPSGGLRVSFYIPF